MQTPVAGSSKLAQRRSQRVTLALPVLVTSLEPRVPFQETCETIAISVHGCSVRAPRSLETGVPVRLELPSGKRSATGRVVMGGRRTKDGKSWEIGLELDPPSNLWGIAFPSAEANTAPFRRDTTPLASTPSSTRKDLPGSSTPTAPPRFDAPSSTTPTRPSGLSEASASPGPGATRPWDDLLAQFEPELRERARIIAAEFESDYRTSLGALLARLRADLDERAAADWERLKQQTQESLQEAARGLRQEANERLARWQREADSEILQHLGKELESGLKNLARDVAQQLKPAHDRLLAQTIEELHGLEAQVEQQSQALASQTQAEAALEERVAVALKTKEYVESLEAKLPQTVDQRVQQALAAPLEELHGLEAQVEQQGQALANQTQAEAALEERVSASLEELHGLEAQVEQQSHVLASNVEAEAALRKRVEVALQARDYIESLVRELPKNVDQRVQEVLSTSLERLRGQLEEQFSPRTLEERLARIGEPAVGELRQKLFEDFDRHEREFLDRVNVRVEEAMVATGSVREYAHQWRAELATLLEQSVAESRRRLEESLAVRWQETQGAFQRLEEQASRAEAAAQEVRRLLEALQEQRELLEIQNIGLQQQGEEIRAWVRREEEQFQRVIQSALAEARGEIRGRLQQGTETTQELLEQRWHEGADRLDKLAANHTAELARRLELACTNLQQLQEQTQQSAGTALDAKRAEILERFQKEADALAGNSLAECQTELGEALESVSTQLREKLSQKARARRAPPPDRRAS